MVRITSRNLIRLRCLLLLFAGIHTYDSDQGSKDVYAFLRIFFDSFDKFQGNDFVITGESYAGR
jgi:hypothetical protein